MALLNPTQGPDSGRFKSAQLNFIRSMAAYSVVCYILQVQAVAKRTVVKLRAGSAVLTTRTCW